MSKTTLFILGLFFAGIIVRHACAEVCYISPQELADASDVIIIGTVSAIKSTAEKEATYWRKDAAVRHAEVAVNEVLKGEPAKAIIIKYVYDQDVEPDVQDPNLVENEKALFYLKSDKNAYRVVQGWSGVARLFGEEIYHQYSATDTAKYLQELKDYIK